MVTSNCNHVIKYNKSTAYPTEMVFFDTETTPFHDKDDNIQQPFKLGTAMYWRKQPTQSKDTVVWHDFTEPKEFFSWLDSLTHGSNRIVVIAHNMQFDFMTTNGFHWLRQQKWTLQKWVSNSSICIFRYTKDKKTLLFLDNMNYFRTSLKNLGNMVDLPKLTMPPENAPDEEWRVYNRRDVEILYKVWMEWLDYLRSGNYGYFGLTLPSQAQNAFRHRFMTHEIVHHTFEKPLALERGSYRGGRVECFQLGELPLQQYQLLDVNSMYPYVMRKYEYPVKIVESLTRVSIAELKRWLDTYCVIADVLLESTHNAYALNYDGKAIYPIGKFRVSLTTEELKFALEHDTIKEIYRINIYKKAPIFVKYVNHFWRERVKFDKANNKIYKQITKGFLNMLYGKFGQHNLIWEANGEDDEDMSYTRPEIDAQTGERYTVKCIQGQLFISKGYEEAQNNFVAVAAEVTANARLELYHLYSDFADDTYYCDTDSLLVNDNAYNAINIGGTVNAELGGLKVDKSATHVVLHGAKDYVFGNITRIKGISKTAQKIDDTTYITYPQVGLLQALHNGDINKMVWQKRVKHLSRRYTKGITMPNNTIRPLIMTYEHDRNWLDYETMLKQYGVNARYGFKYLNNIMNYGYKVPMDLDRLMNDYSPADRMAIANEKLTVRRRSEAIYQRG